MRAAGWWKYLVPVMLCLHPLVLPARQIVGAEALSLGQATTALNEDAWAIFANPAALVPDHINLSFYSVRYYGLKALTDIAFTVSSPIKWGVLATGIHQYGDDLYKEGRYSLAYALKIDSLQAGFSFNYHHLQFGGSYPSLQTFSVDAGLIASLGSQTQVGARITNLSNATYGEDEKLARVLAFGLAYRLEPYARITFDLLKDVRFPLSYRAGLQLRMLGTVTGRLGITTEPNTYAFGLGYDAERWKVNLAVQHHEYLGLSPGLDLIFYFR